MYNIENMFSLKKSISMEDMFSLKKSISWKTSIPLTLKHFMEDKHSIDIKV